jgi:hypothetical protein
LTKHGINLLYSKNGCKVLGHFKTEKGNKKIKLFTDFGNQTSLRCVNTTQISKGYSEINFKTNNMICRHMDVKLTQLTNTGLQIPKIVKIKPNIIINFNQKGRPFILRPDIVKIPIIAKNILKQNKAILRLEITQNDDENIKVQKVQISTEQIQHYNEKEITEKQQKYLSQLQEGCKLISNLTVDSTSILAVSSEDISYIPGISQTAQIPRITGSSEPISWPHSGDQTKDNIARAESETLKLGENKNLNEKVCK